MITYIKIVAAGLFVASLIILGWKVAGWRNDAMLLEGARLELRNEQERRINDQVRLKQANDERFRLESELAGKRAAIEEKVKIVKQTVIKYVPKNVECDLNEHVARGLQHLREGGDDPMPPTSP